MLRSKVGIVVWRGRQAEKEEEGRMLEEVPADRSYFTLLLTELEETGRWGAVGESAAGLAWLVLLVVADIRPHVP